MIDVHPAPHAAHTWKDFFIHIATIVVGLLIALSLEQIIEHFHHATQIQELRNSLAEERNHNREVYRRATEVYLQDAAYCATISASSLTCVSIPAPPRPAFLASVLWPRHTFEPSMSAWNDTGQSSVLAMMPRDEVNKYSNTYFNLQRTLDGYNAMGGCLRQRRRHRLQTSNPSKLSPRR